MTDAEAMPYPQTDWEQEARCRISRSGKPRRTGRPISAWRDGACALERSMTGEHAGTASASSRAQPFHFEPEHRAQTRAQYIAEERGHHPEPAMQAA
jgi:hypothetical protein